MPLGIHTRYQHHEATYVALRLANWALENGSEASIYPTTPKRLDLDVRWDHVANAQRGRRFTEWAREQSTIVWTHVPPIEQVVWSKRQGIQTVFFPLWHELNPTDREIIGAFDAVLAPSRAVGQLIIRRWNGRRTYVAPWDVGLPFSAKDARQKRDQKWILLPLYDNETQKSEMTAIEIAGRALGRYDNTVLTVMYNSWSMGSAAKRRLQKFQKFFGDRVRLLRSVSLAHRPFVFRCHDLTLWPTHAENTAMLGLLSMTMGTPVIAFEGTPLDDMLSNSNGLPIPCGQATDEGGIPSIIPDYGAFEEGLCSLLESDEYLHRLQQTVLTGLPERRSRFNSGIASVYVD